MGKGKRGRCVIYGLNTKYYCFSCTSSLSLILPDENDKNNNILKYVNILSRDKDDLAIIINCWIRYHKTGVDSHFSKEQREDSLTTKKMHYLQLLYSNYLAYLLSLTIALKFYIAFTYSIII